MTVEERIRASFERQPFMATLGARMVRVGEGEAEIEIAYDERLTQQHGFLHAGVVTAVADSACGYAARFLGSGRLVRAGRTLTVVSGEFRGEDGDAIALLNGTMMAARDRPGLAD